MSAVTTRLFIGDCPFPHIVTDRADEAAWTIRQGETVSVPDENVAAETLVLLGMTRDDAIAQIRLPA